MNNFAEINKDYLLANYESKSTYEMADELGTYPNQVRRALLKLGAKVANRSEAQKRALASGRHTHPTAGKVRDEATKLRISESMHKHWTGLSDEERERRSEMSRQQWEDMSEADKSAIREAAAVAVRQAAKDGSKLEKFLQKSLQEKGFDVIFHKKGLVVNSNLEVDIFIPALKTAIEVDGPAHFFPVWGEDSLRRHITADAEKAGLLLNEGLCIVRIKHLNKNITQHHMRKVLDGLVEVLNNIDKKFPVKKERYIELEIT